VKSSVSGDNLTRNPFKIPARKDDSENSTPVIMPAPVKLLSEDLAFQDSLHEFLTDNPDFLVVGCVGLQWSGKSTVLSHLAGSKYFTPQ
jgi:protein SMG9